MATRAIKPKRDEGARPWSSLPERAPSIIRSDQPMARHIIGLISLLLVAAGALAMLAPQWGLRYIFGPGWGFFWFALGVAGLLFHAFDEKDAQFRFLFEIGGTLLLVAGIVLRVLPAADGFGALFLPYGVPCLALALAFLVSVGRNEPSVTTRQRIQRIVGVVGVLMAIAGFF